MFAAMTNFTGLVVLFLGKLYGKVQGHEPLSTVILALLVHRFFQKYEPQSPGICAFLPLILPAMVSGAFMQGASSILGSLSRVYAIFYTSLILSVVLYRLSPLHPLARYPGPVLARISKLWFAHLNWQGKQHVHYRNLHKKYGDVVRVGPNEIMLSDISVIEPLLGPGGWGKANHWHARALHAPVVPLSAVNDHVEHARRRRTWMRGFSPAALKDYEEIVNKRVVQLTEALSARKSVDLARLFGDFTHDVMNDMAFGGGVEMLRDGDLTGHWPLIESGMKAFALIGHLPWLARFMMLVPGSKNDLDNMRKACFERAILRKKKGTKQKDLFYYLSDELGAEKEEIPFEIVVNDGDLVVVAGSDTAKTVLSSLFFYLLSNPEKIAKLREEIDRFYPPGELLSSRCFQEMSYLDACINETLRLSPAVPSGSQRDVGPNPDPSKGRTFGSYYFPEGTVVGIHTFTLHRDPRNFSPFTDEFWPERWLIAQSSMELPSSIPKADFVHNTAAFIPFSCGPANCIGKPLAILELRMAAVSILQNLDVRFEDGYARTWEDEWKDHFVLMTGKLPVVFSNRR
ncbi:cytochrome P450 [Thelephora ganbajun]|uniref:Cytochrome P450 n=1 Tax=Thelephora ganbajun TaxID=370292 RepID=A0ACB6ZNQ6_THEGA|nr:cytochrome P450 [Thelephora ganbajun]